MDIDNTFGKSVNDLFRGILFEIQKGILCNYRNVFYTYSESAVFLDDVDGILISTRRKRDAPSFTHDYYSVIMADLIDKWSKKVAEFARDLETKLLL